MDAFFARWRGDETPPVTVKPHAVLTLSATSYSRVCLAPLWVSLWMGLMILFFRRGLDCDVGLLFGLWCLLAVALLSPLWLLSGSKLAVVRPCALLLPLLVLGSPLLLFALGQSWGGYLYPALFAATVLKARPFISFKWDKAALGMAFLLCLYAAYLFVVAQEKFSNPVMFQELAWQGVLHKDSYFHLAIASMIQHHGVASIGLDGLLPLSYHVGSHYWMAALSVAFASDLMMVYPYAKYLLLLPLLMGSVMLSAAFWSRGRVVNLLLLSLLAIVVLDAASTLAYYRSESYAASLVVFMLSLPLLFALTDRQLLRIQVKDILILLLFGVAMLLLKTSTGAVFMVMFAAVLARCLSVKAAFFLLALLAGFLLWRFLDDIALYAQQISPFYFYRAGFPVIQMYGSYVAPLVLLLLLWLQRSRRSAPLRFGGMAFGMLAGGVACVLPSLLFPVLWHNAWYFLNIMQWLCLPLLVAVWRQMVAAHARRWWTAAWLGGCGLVLLMTGAAVHRTGEKLWSSSIATPQIYMKAIQHKLGYRVTQRVHDAVAQHGITHVFVPVSNRAFWKSRLLCRVGAFFLPALTGVPLVQGLLPYPPGKGCSVVRDYQVGAYGYRAYPDASRPVGMTALRLCGRHPDSRILVLNDMATPARDRILVCNTAGHPVGRNRP